MNYPEPIHEILNMIEDLIDQNKDSRSKLGELFDAVQLFAFMACGEDGLVIGNGHTYWLCDPEKNTECNYRKKTGTCFEYCHLTLNKKYRWIPPEKTEEAKDD